MRPRRGLLRLGLSVTGLLSIVFAALPAAITSLAKPAAGAGIAVDLGTLTVSGCGGSTSSVGAVSDSGQVVGTSGCLDGYYSPHHAFSWTAGGGMVDLGTLAGDWKSSATAVNNNGQVVGESDNVVSGDSHAFSWTAAGGMVDLGTLPGGNYSYAYAVNDSGQVVGSAGTASGPHAFSWTAAGGMVDLGVLGTNHFDVTAKAVNRGGEVVGDASYDYPMSQTHAFSWTAAGGMVDLGTLPGGSDSYAYAVNGSGQVVGSADSDSQYTQHAFSWTALGGMVDLGTLPGGTYSDASAVNDSGQVVGSADIAGGVTHAFSWTAAGGMVDLGTLPGGSYSSAVAVNGSGLVVGSADIAGGVTHAFSWTAAGGMVDLGTFAGDTFSNATAVNGRGDVVGGSWGFDSQHAVIWPGGTVPQDVQVTGRNGGAFVTWSPPSVGATQIAGYTVTATPDPGSLTFPVPPTLASSYTTVEVPATQNYVSIVGKLAADCHTRYSFTVTPVAVQGSALHFFSSTPTRPVRTSGYLSSGAPSLAIIVIDGEGSADQILDSNGNNLAAMQYLPVPASSITTDPNVAATSYCPEAKPVGGIAYATQVPLAPIPFLGDWNGLGRGWNGQPFSQDGRYPETLVPPGNTTVEPSHRYMLDAYAALGAVVLPYSYNGAGFTPTADAAHPWFQVASYTTDDSTTGSLTSQTEILDAEVRSINRVWPTTKILIFGHSWGGLIAEQYWSPSSDVNSFPGVKGGVASENVVGVISLDSPVNGVRNCQAFVLGFLGCTFNAKLSLGIQFDLTTLWNHLEVNDAAAVSADARQNFVFRSVGTEGDGGYDSGDSPQDGILSQMLFSCSGLVVETCTGLSPIDFSSPCPVTSSLPQILQDQGHFLVKYCPGVLDFETAAVAPARATFSSLPKTNLTAAYLAASDLSGLSFAGSNLSGANLSGSDLSGANLTGSNLTGAILPGANLTGANEAGANLTSANLTGANLTSANLSGANLTGANLTAANLSGANLSGANLTKAKDAGALWTGVIWSNTTCPDGTTSKHDGGSCVGHL